ncbi:EpsG family protein [Acinetobacter lwoffii]|uniref:EpsG family protein n=1 Tax=Acinetobacter lwoffii TaxID=28090 RepID=UPI0002D05B50|nr:EpsG family protein [Acinetobacter lwoffii]ENW27110.1 hypothetical protein F924_02314 [Acinetobacter lwoffii ATCC 9957 = CIP 70.31]
MNKSYSLRFFGGIWAFILALIVVNIPWLINLSYYHELDPFAYVRMLDIGGYENSLKFDFSNIFSYVSNEWLWRKIIIFLENFGFGSETIFFIVLPLIIYFLNFYILFEKKKLIYAWILVHPLGLMFYFNQLRMALAISLVALLMIIPRNKYYYLLFLPLCLIHSSILIFLIVFFTIDLILEKVNNNNVIIFLLIFMGILLAYITGPMIEHILTSLGDRRAEHYGTNEWNSSLLSSLYWGLILAIFVFCSVFYEKKITFEVAITIVFTSLVVISPFFVGGYPYRFLTAIFLFFIVSIKQLPKISRYAVIFLLAFSFVYQGINELNWMKSLMEIF